jgi:anti-anti-sigma factor
LIAPLRRNMCPLMLAEFEAGASHSSYFFVIGLGNLNLFISWSGKDSKSTGSALRAFLPNVIPSVTPWMSERDIPAGGLWKSELHQQLSNADFGVVCVTSENTIAPWLLYELGCLAMRVPRGQVVPLVQGIEPKDLPEPLCSFQSLSANRDGVWKLVQTVNKAAREPLNDEALSQNFGEHWPGLESEWAGHLVVTHASGIYIVSVHLLRLLDEHDVALVRRRLQTIIEAGQNRLVIDLEKVQFISSAALAAFLLNGRTAETAGGRMVFANAATSIRQVFGINRIDRIFKFFDNTDDAVEFLKRETDQSNS